jgi:hypothetical protein
MGAGKGAELREQKVARNQFGPSAGHNWLGALLQSIVPMIVSGGDDAGTGDLDDRLVIDESGRLERARLEIGARTAKASSSIGALRAFWISMTRGEGHFSGAR